MSNFFYVGAFEKSGWRNELWVSHSYERGLSGLGRKEIQRHYEAAVEKLHADGHIGRKAEETRSFDDGLREVIHAILRYPADGARGVAIYLGLAGDREDALRQSQRL